MSNIKEYRENSAINVSSLKDYGTSPIYYKKKHIDKSIKQSSSDAMTLGTLAHAMFLTPDLIDQDFAIDTFENTVSSEKLINYLLELINSSDEDITIEDVTMSDLIDAVNTLELFSNIKKEETLIKHLGAMNIYNNLKFRLESKDKMIVTPEIYKKAEELVEKLKSWEFLDLYILDVSKSIPEGIEVMNEEIIYWTYVNKELDIIFKCKSLLDQIVINHKLKTVKINDLKFTSVYDPASFKKHALGLGYHMQAYFYKSAVKEWIKENYPGYKFDGFNYICIPTNSELPPYCFQCTDDFYSYGKTGGLFEGNSYKGIDELFESLQWSLDTNNWYFHKHVYLNKGLFHL